MITVQSYLTSSCIYFKTAIHEYASMVNVLIPRIFITTTHEFSSSYYSCFRNNEKHVLHCFAQNKCECRKGNVLVVLVFHFLHFGELLIKQLESSDALTLLIKEYMIQVKYF